MSLTADARLGMFEILNLVGAGGMGVVYQAKDTRLNRILAIKILSSRISDSPELRERFGAKRRPLPASTTRISAF